MFGKKTPINYQINLYLFSRITIALIELVYKKYVVGERTAEEGEEREEYWVQRHSFKIMAGVVWGVVMWLFYINEAMLHESLASSMKDLYIASERPVKSWKEFIPYSYYK